MNALIGGLKTRKHWGWAAFLWIVLLSSSSVEAQNRIYIDDQTLEAGETGLEVFVKIDNDFNTYGVSFSLDFDPSLIQITAIELAGVAASAEWDSGSDGDQIDNTNGHAKFGIVTEITYDTPTDTFIAIGTGQIVAKLTIDTLATPATSTTLSFVDRDDAGDFGAVNALVDDVGNTYREGGNNPLALNSATLTIDPFLPVIQLVENNQGSVGDDFTVVGLNFDIPGLTATVCGAAATVSLAPDGQTLTVTAPDCPICAGATDVCCGDLVVSTENGSDTYTDGFCYDPPPVPTISSLTLNSGLAGQNFFVSGSNFSQPGIAVTVCGATATFSLINDTTLNVTAPDCGSTGWAIVEVCNDFGCVDETNGFFYDDPPIATITSVTSNQGLSGQLFTVVGDNFSRPDLSVQVCGVAASYNLVNDETLEVTAPDCGSTGWAELQICNDIGCDQETNGFFYEEPPAAEITSISNNQGLADQVFTVVGDNFTQPGLAVQVCGVAATVNVVNDETLEVTAPNCGSTGWAVLQVCNDIGCDQETQGFFYEDPPAAIISSVTSNQGLAGQVFTVNGDNFSQSGLTVEVCGVAASVNVVNDETLQVTAPACGDLGWAILRVCNDIGCDQTNEGFLYEAPPVPTITTITENTGFSGKEFTVNGTNFDQTGFAITVCGNPASFNVVSATEATVTAPACGAFDWAEVEVCNTFGCASEANGFFYETPTPTISSITQNTGLRGTEFTVFGTHFDEADLAVTVCGLPATVVMESAVELTVTAPDCPDLDWAVIEVCTVHGCASEAEGFFYESGVPTISAIQNNSGFAGAQFTVLGGNFDLPGLAVTVCDASADVSVISATRIDVTAPACAPLGWASIEICNDFGCVDQAQGFNYENPEPTITSFSDNTGLSGKEFTITGTNFDLSGIQVQVCGVVAQITVDSATSIRATAPECGSLGWTTVEVCNDFGCVDDNEGFFYEDPPPAPSPIITSASDNEGFAGETFTVTGSNFAVEDLDVTVCGVEATHTVDSDTQLTITSPDCEDIGWAPVRVCNSHGCDQLNSGFLYESGIPTITSISDNVGLSGKEFVVTGTHFDLLTLAVNVCEVEAQFVVESATTLRVTSPECGNLGWATLDICNDNGCTDDPEGFFYEDPPPDPSPVIISAENNTGLEGDSFTVIGENFDEGLLVVTVCEGAASYSVDSPNQLTVTAPDCAELGWAPLRICNNHGCDQLNSGFFYEEEPPETQFLRGDPNYDGRIDIADATTILFDQFLGVAFANPCRDAGDCNDDGKVDLSDAIYMLVYQFVGGDPPPAPFPEAGIDPTSDDLPEC